MKQISKITYSFLLLTMLLVSCGPVTRVPSVVPTGTTNLPIPTSVPPTLVGIPPTETGTPKPRAEDYQLLPWSANDPYHESLIQTSSQDYYIGFNQTRNAYDRVMYAQQLLRDSASDWRDVAWKMVQNYPTGVKLPGMRENQDLLAFLMEDLLNNEKITPEDLHTLVEARLPSYYGCYSTNIADVPSRQGSYLIVNNLFGDGQDARLFFTGNCMGTAIYALHTVNGQYHVDKVRDWQALEITFAGYGLTLNASEDVNKNGIPEVIVEVSHWASGGFPFYGKNIEFYEWDLGEQKFWSDDTEVFEEVVCFDYSPCDDQWKITDEDISGIHPLVVRELHVTMTDEFGEASTCDPLVIEHKYLWEHGKFRDYEQRLLPPTDERIECRISWALPVLNLELNTSQAIDIISESLDGWPASMNKIWGPASQDYFALRLGLYYDIHEREDEAVSLLKTVAEHPYNSDFQFVPELASAYLETRATQGKAKACVELRLLQQQAEFDMESFVYVPVEAIREKWGIGPAVWREEIDEICDEKNVVELLAQQAQIVSIVQWLGEFHLQSSVLQTIHDKPSLHVWMVSLPTQFLSWNEDGTALERFEDQQIWLLVATPAGSLAAYVDDASKGAQLSVGTLNLDQSGLLITIEPDDAYVQRFSIFHVAPNGAVQSELSDFYVDGFVDHEKNEIVTLTEVDGSGQPEVAVYRWNSAAQSLDRRIINFDFQEAQDTAEMLLFQERDYEKTILYINEFLMQAPPEEQVPMYCDSGNCNYYPEWYRPYLRYLLAMAHELLGDVYEARSAYFALWQDFPEHPFGLVAQHRLGKRQP